MIREIMTIIIGVIISILMLVTLRRLLAAHRKSVRRRRKVSRIARQKMLQDDFLSRWGQS